MWGEEIEPWHPRLKLSGTGHLKLNRTPLECPPFFGTPHLGGFLGAWLPADNAELQSLLARALPPFGGQAASGSMTVRRASGVSRLVVHVNPVGDRQMDFRARRVAALVLVVEPGS